MSDRAATPRKRILGLEPGQAMHLVGIVAAMVVVTILNVMAARHYKRWDWTKTKRYTLSTATRQTLRDLPGTVQVWVLMGAADPMEQSVKQLLVSYAAETDKLDVRYVDPDRDRLAFEDVRKKFRIEAGRTEDNRVVTDAVVVVAHEGKHWFITTSDLVEVVEGDDVKAKPREEQALTRAIRNVLRGERSKICFTAGHGEPGLSEGGEQGLLHLKQILDKDNYVTASVDTTEPNAIEPFKGCDVVVVPGLRGPLAPDEENRLKTYLMTGGNALVAVSPINAVTEKGLAPPGLADALAPFGVGLDEDLVFEADAAMVVPQSKGIRFLATPKQHAVTAALVREGEQKDPPRVLLHFARSLKRVSRDGAAVATELLATSPKAFGVVDIAGAADWTDTPAPKDADLRGPLALAMASERPKPAPSAPHGPRVVVVGSASVMLEKNWREPLQLRGAAVFVESAISWLAAKPEIVDIPERAAAPAGVHLTEESRSEVKRYVLGYMPLAAGLLGVAVALRRRATEGKPRTSRPPAGKKRDRSGKGGKKAP